MKLKHLTRGFAGVYFVSAVIGVFGEDPWRATNVVFIAGATIIGLLLLISGEAFGR